MNENIVSRRNAVEPAVRPQETPVTTSGVSALVETVSVVEEAPISTPTTNEKTGEITSPTIGIVHLQPTPDKENFAKIGDTVRTGGVVCIVGATKLMNEITAAVDDVTTGILVSSEGVVESGQPLFRVAEGK